MPVPQFDEQLIAHRISVAINRTGLDNSDVAARLGVTRRAVEHWRVGARRPRAQLLISLAELVGVTAAWLMGRG